jgi:hypothetical protein
MTVQTGTRPERRQMPNQAGEVDRYMKTLDHALKDGVQQLRLAILSSNEQITEHVKWKAPSFCYNGEDRVTFRLQPGDRIQLIFHRGAKVRGDSDQFAFEDHTGLLQWLAKDRAVMTLHDMTDVERKQAAIVELVDQWVTA